MNEVRICRNCDTKVSDSDQFCSYCGANIGAKPTRQGDDGTRYYNPIQTPGRAKLTMIAGSSVMANYNLGSMRHIVGRNRGDIVFTEDEFISPEHAAFTYTRDGLQLKDFSSFNGTYLSKSEEELKDRPIYIIVGKQFFRIEPVSVCVNPIGAEDTMKFVSPVQDYKFRVVHVLVGGRDGLSVCSPNNNVVIGRQGCDCTIEYDPYLSPRHVQIKEENGRIFVRDLDSKNGTFFRIDEDVLLADGDYIQLGKEIIRVEINN